MCYQGKWSSTQLNDRLPGAQVIVPSKVTRAVRVECQQSDCSVTVMAKPCYCHWTRSPAQLFSGTLVGRLLGAQATTGPARSRDSQLASRPGTGRTNGNLAETAGIAIAHSIFA